MSKDGTRTARVKPYTQLLTLAREYAWQVVNARRVTMFYYERAHLTELYERIAAAHQLGYDVQATADTENRHIVFHYVKRAEVPWEFRP